MEESWLRTFVAGNFSDGHSTLTLMLPRLRHIVGTKWSTTHYLNMGRLQAQRKADEAEVMA